jgi:hypothetical protein
MRPQSIVQFERLYILGIVLSLAASVWTFGHGAELLPAGAPPQAVAMLPWVAGFGIVIGLAINLCLLFFIAHRGSEVAKWIFVILFALGVAGVLRGFGHSVVVLPLAPRLLSLCHVIIQGVCMWLMFRPDARPWFRR